MGRHQLRMGRVNGLFAVCKLDPASTIPDWATRGELYALVRTCDELSIVCPQSLVPPGVHYDRDWKAVRVAGPLAFDLVGVLASLVTPLADAGISVFAISTFDTDYLLIKAADMERAEATLRQSGHSID